MKKKITVLGSGIVGSLIASELNRDYEVSCADKNITRLEKLKSSSGVISLESDLSDPRQLEKALSEADLAVIALPGSMGYKTLERVIETGTDVVDISFFAEDPFSLEEKARQKGVTAVVDCGVAPGLCNIILGFHLQRDKILSYKCLVGGLIQARFAPFEYKSVFSPSDVIAEYVREARLVKNGSIVFEEALSEPENIDFEGIGTLTAFNTDGLRTLTKTADIPFMSEKTLRYPKTYEYLKVLKDAGFFSDIPVEFEGAEIKPCDFSDRLLSEKWRIEDNDRDITCMKIFIESCSENGKELIEYTLTDYYDEKEKILSMARTTGYTCCAVSRLVLEGKISRKGILPPEEIGREEKDFSFVLDYLRNKGVRISEKRQA
ncbi:saccharopine dehydrogenase NADP-binding domain-containing protein [candidate division WOR-3 bacterium]|nr:saccharopine dehydrogenase NADP-binding domain-containing protein [candidate division WOR-3 bacterium]